jgi:hypothetical protein
MITITKNKQQGEFHARILGVPSLVLAAFIDREDMMIRIGFKRCTKCGEMKGLSEFGKGKDKLGLRHECRACLKRYYQDHKEEEKQRCEKNKERNLREGVIITEKRCSRCGKIKSVDEFNKNYNVKDGTSCWCKECEKQNRQDCKKEIKERLNKCHQAYREYNLKNGIIITEKRCPKCGKIKNVNEFSKSITNKDGVDSQCKDCKKQYYQDNKEAINGYQCKWARLRRQTDPMFRLNQSISSAVNHALKSKGGSKQGKRLKDILDYTIQDLITYLESKFEDGMTWENHGNGLGKWNIDHIRPISSFNFTSPDDEEFKQCWALSNLQPLWWKENMRKGNKII